MPVLDPRRRKDTWTTNREVTRREWLAALLLDRGADRNATDHGGRPLDLATEKGATEVVRLLQEHTKASTWRAPNPCPPHHTAPGEPGSRTPVLHVPVIGCTAAHRDLAGVWATVSDVAPP